MLWSCQTQQDNIPAVNVKNWSSLQVDTIFRKDPLVLGTLDRTNLTNRKVIAKQKIKKTSIPAYCMVWSFVLLSLCLSAVQFSGQMLLLLPRWIYVSLFESGALYQFSLNIIMKERTTSTNDKYSEIYELSWMLYMRVMSINRHIPIQYWKIKMWQIFL